MSRLRGWGAGLALAATLGALPGWAEEASDKQAAKQHLAEGVKLYQKGYYAEALAAFEQTRRLYPTGSRIYFNIGQVRLKLSQVDQAAENFEQFLQGAANDVNVDDSMLDEARSDLKAARATYAVIPLQVQGPGGHAVTHGFQIHVHDVQQDRDTTSSFIYLPVRPAEHQLTIRLEGARSLTVDVVARRAGVQPPQMITLQPADGSATAADGTSSAGTIPRLAVDAGAGSIAATVPPAASLPGPDAGGPLLLAGAGAPAEAASPHLPAYVAWGVGAAAGVGWLVTGLSAAGQVHHFTLSSGGPSVTNSSFCSQATSKSSCTSWWTVAEVADVLAVATGAAAITGGVLWFLAPAPDGSGAQAAVVGHF